MPASDHALLDPGQATPHWPAPRRIGTTAASPEPWHVTLFIQPVHTLAGGDLESATAAFLPDSRSSDHAAWIGRSSGTGGQAGGWLLEAACREAAIWNPAPVAQAAAPPLPVSVPVPAEALWDSILLPQVRAALLQAALPPDLLELRLTERALDEANIDGLMTLASVCSLGARLALVLNPETPDRRDALSGLPLSTVLLPPEMVAALVDCRTAREAAAGSIARARELGARTVALGLDTAQQRDILQDLGCDGGQGPLFGTAMLAAIFTAALEPAATA